MSRLFLQIALAVLFLAGCSLTRQSFLFDDEDAAGIDASGIDAGRRDGGVGIDATISDAGPPCGLSDHSGCTSDQLCCDFGAGPTCIAASEAECTACGTGCDTATSSRCRNRTCECGTLAACAGGLMCDDTSGVCIECTDIADCTAQQCVAGDCVDCDASDNNLGCAGATPICNATSATCEACTMSPDNCLGILTCTASGACGGCNVATHEGCITPSAPVCEMSGGVNVCRACATDTECVSEFSLPQCLSDGRCAQCDPSDNAGCGSAAPICADLGGGVFACRACMGGECSAGEVCLLSGACQTCGADGGPCCLGSTCNAGAVCQSGLCTGCGGTAQPCCVGNVCSGSGRFCNAGSCVDCGDPSELCCPGDMCNAGGACSASVCQNCGDPGEICCAGDTCNGGAACLGGVCQNCGAQGQPCCGGSTCNGALFCTGGSCEECIGTSTGCTDPIRPVCDSGSSMCRGCLSDGDCAGNPAGSFCITSGPSAGACGSCDPATSLPCSGSTPICDPAGTICRPCMQDTECAPLPGVNDFCATVGPRTGECGRCNPGSHAPCTSGSGETYCHDSFLMCVQCQFDSHCFDLGIDYLCDPGIGRCLCTGPLCPCGPNMCNFNEYCDRATLFCLI